MAFYFSSLGLHNCHRTLERAKRHLNVANYLSKGSMCIQENNLNGEKDTLKWFIGMQSLFSNNTEYKEWLGSATSNISYMKDYVSKLVENS